MSVVLSLTKDAVRSTFFWNADKHEDTDSNDNDDNDNGNDNSNGKEKISATTAVTIVGDTVKGEFTIIHATTTCTTTGPQNYREITRKFCDTVAPTLFSCDAMTCLTCLTGEEGKTGTTVLLLGQ